MKKLIVIALWIASYVLAQSPCTVSQQYPGSVICNVDGSTGVSANHYVKWNAGGTGVVIGATTDTTGVVGIANATQTGGGGLLVTRYGPALVAFDGATTAGHWCGISGSVNGDFTDTGAAGASAPTAVPQCVILQTIGSAGNAWVDLLAFQNRWSITIGSGTAALGTSAISSATCAAAVTVSATGVATTDVISFTPNADITAVTGYAPATAGGLSIYPYPTANNVNFKVCNWSTGSITPGAVTLNWRVVR